MIKSHNCPICKSKEIHRLKESSFLFQGNNIENNLMNDDYVRLWIFFKKMLNHIQKVNFNISFCKTCGFIFLNPRFTENEMRIKYETINEIKSVKYRLNKFPAYNLKDRANRVFELIKKNYTYNLNEIPKILDYGGASGYILIPFSDKFECFIIDYQKWKYKKNIKYIGKTLNDLKKTDKFDVILLLHTLEHIIDPREFIQTIVKFLKYNGIIYVEVPLGCFHEWKNLGNPITHVNFFSEESLYKCFKLCGLNINHLSTKLQWVTHNKMMCLNIIATKQKEIDHVRFKNVLSTKAQMSKLKNFYYYLLIALGSIPRFKVKSLLIILKNTSRNIL